MQQPSKHHLQTTHACHTKGIGIHSFIWLVEETDRQIVKQTLAMRFCISGPKAPIQTEQTWLRHCQTLAQVVFFFVISSFLLKENGINFLELKSAMIYTHVCGGTEWISICTKISVSLVLRVQVWIHTSPNTFEIPGTRTSFFSLLDLWP